MTKYTPQEQALIDRVELALDYNMFVPDEDLKNYNIIMGKSTSDENTCS